ncbi:MAG: hypothetical protein QGH32_05145 [Alphaproteobacteria bacterium]|nr:hypothetical protein [Alphaproteobacteria bacterium]
MTKDAQDGDVARPGHDKEGHHGENHRQGQGTTPWTVPDGFSQEFGR